MTKTEGTSSSTIPLSGRNVRSGPEVRVGTVSVTVETPRQRRERFTKVYFV